MYRDLNWSSPGFVNTWLSRESQFFILGWSQEAESGMASLPILKKPWAMITLPVFSWPSRWLA